MGKKDSGVFNETFEMIDRWHQKQHGYPLEGKRKYWAEMTYQSCASRYKEIAEHQQKRIDKLEYQNKQLKGNKEYYDRMFAKSIVVPTGEYAEMVTAIKEFKIALGKIVERHDFWHNRNCHVKTELRNAIMEASELL